MNKRIMEEIKGMSYEAMKYINDDRNYRSDQSELRNTFSVYL